MRKLQGRAHKLPELKLSAPETLSFREAFEETVAFLDHLRDVTLARGRRRYRIYVDLTPIQHLSVPCAIVLAAEFHRWSLIQNFRMTVRDAHKWHPGVRNLLSDLGVFRLLRIPPVSSQIDFENITLTPLSSGVRTDGKKLDGLQAQFENVLENFTKNPQMYAGLMEAVENAISHAYPPDYEPRHRFAGHRWWAASSIDTTKGALRFFVFDQGAGIPHTLPSSTLWESLRTRIAQLTQGIVSNDSQMLKAALEVGRTRTEKEYRGLGLRRMADVVANAPSAYMRILSGKGEMVYNGDGTIETHDHGRHIGGTLIEWSMSADAFTSDQEDEENEKI